MSDTGKVERTLGILNSVICDKQAKGYWLERIYKLKLTNPQKPKDRKFRR